MRLLSPLTLSDALTLPNRVVMAPMTRHRADADGTPLPVVAEHYAQRAGAGLIVTEGVFPAYAGQSDARLPGLVTPAHERAWRGVADAVHAAGGRIVLQLMHGGRAGHPGNRYDGSVPQGPSAVPTPWPARLPDGTKVAPVTPGVLSVPEIARVIDQHVTAARTAVAAGFDAVELHGANSYLIHQFLADNTNLRTDRYGVTRVQDRIRFAVELTEAVADAVGAERVGLRLSPGNPQFGMSETDPAPTYRALLAALDGLGLLYLHLTEGDAYPALSDLRPRWRRPVIANVGENRAPTDPATAEALLRAGLADAVGFGRRFIANPDLVERIAVGAPLAEVHLPTLYGPDHRGYTDYPRLVTPAHRGGQGRCGAAAG